MEKKMKVPSNISFENVFEVVVKLGQENYLLKILNSYLQMATIDNI